MTVAAPASRGAGATCSSQRASRDLRLDFCRGLVLAMIYVDHAPNNVLAGFTLQVAGFADATEVFVLISGVAAALAYERILDRGGTGALARAVGNRILRLYAVHLLLVALCLGVLVAASRYSNAPGYAASTVTRSMPSIDVAGLIGVATLQILPDLLNILPLYMVLMAWLPVVLVLMRRSRLLLLAVSAGLWATTQAALVTSPYGVPGWYFNPLAWQLLFTVGIFIGHGMRTGLTPPQRPWLAALAAGYLGLAFAGAAPWTQLPHLADARVVQLEWVEGISKSNLSLLRLANIAALAYLFAYLVPSGSAWLEARIPSLFRLLGRHGLLVFAVATVLDHLAVIARLEGLRGVLHYQVPVNLIGLGLLLLVAWGADLRTRSGRLTPAERQRCPALAARVRTVEAPIGSHIAASVL